MLRSTWFSPIAHQKFPARMRALFVTIALVALVATTCTAQELTFGPEVIQLTTSSFDTIVKPEEFMVVAFTGTSLFRSSNYFLSCHQIRPPALLTLSVG